MANGGVGEEFEGPPPRPSRESRCLTGKRRVQNRAGSAETFLEDSLHAREDWAARERQCVKYVSARLTSKKLHEQHCPMLLGCSMYHKVRCRFAFALFVTMFACASGVAQAQHQNAGPAFRGVDNARGIPGCKIVRLVNGQSLMWNGQPVSVGGTCPPNFLRGRYVNTSTVVINGRTCRWASSAPNSGFCQ